MISHKAWARPRSFSRAPPNRRARRPCGLAFSCGSRQSPARSIGIVRLSAAATYANHARALDHPVKVSPVARPQPVPPPEARPSQLSVTDIENWLRDPYTIYAKHVLRLFPLEAIDTPPGAADRGTFIHEAVGEFTKKFADALPADVAARTHCARQEAFRATRRL